MRLAFMAFGTTVLAAAALAACTTSNPNNAYIAPPSGPVSSGALSLSGTSEQQQLPGADGITGVVTYGAGSGVVTVATSTTAPAATIPVEPSALRRTKSGTSPTVFYVTISSQVGATLSGLPGIALVLPSPAATPYQEAQFTGTVWTNVEVGVISGNSVQFNSTSKAITIPAGGSLYLAIYQGSYPAPTPTPTPTPQATPTNVLADPGFENSNFGVYTYNAPATPPPPNTTGWTQCSITATEAGVSAPHAISAYTPNPATTPAAVIDAAGTTIQQGTASPVPTVTTTQVHSGTYSAVFGSLFSTYNAANFGYNGLCQTVTIPADATISLFLWGTGNEGATYLDFDLMLLDTSGNLVTTLDDQADITGTSPGDTTWQMVSVPSSTLVPYVGKTYELFVGIWTKAGSGSGSTKYSGYYFVDDMSLSGIP
jgi:hypothetical protein